MPPLPPSPAPPGANPFPGMPPMIVPSPDPGLTAGTGVGWFFTLYAGGVIVLIALLWGLYVGVTKKHWLPLTLVGGGLICSFVEPMLDVLGHLHWAVDLPFFLYTNFGVSIPLLIPLAYAAFFGLEPYFWSRVFGQGVTVRQVFMVYAAASLSDVVLETPAVLLHAWDYYGVQPYRILDFPWWWSFINGLGFVTIGAIIWYLDPLLKGAQRLWFVLVPVSGMMVAYFAAGWPHFVAINSTLPGPVKWIVTTLSLGLCLVGVRCIAHFVAVPEQTVHWTMPKLFLFRFLLPSQRERMLADHAPARERADREHEGIAPS